MSTPRCVYRHWMAADAARARAVAFLMVAAVTAALLSSVQPAPAEAATATCQRMNYRQRARRRLPPVCRGRPPRPPPAPS